MSVSRVLKGARQSGSRRKTASGKLNFSDLRALGLTPRECEVLQWIWEGKRDCEIATVLGLNPRTVGNHAYNIFRKLNVEARAAAAKNCALALFAVLLAT